MVPEQLEPRLDLLRKEYVLVQAWKKTASYIRYHNWFSDTLALDRTSANLPAFLRKLAEDLQSSERWPNGFLRIVPAPKSQRWTVQDRVWQPVQNGATSPQLRPLAHVCIADQVVATAMMLCLADRVETLQGDPRGQVNDQKSRRQVISYGNRLFCDKIAGDLRHRWGSAKLYRAYFQDYRKFLSRPEVAARPIVKAGKRVYVVHADLDQFYDRVRPKLLAGALDRIRLTGDDPEFFSLAGSVLNWGWHPHDQEHVSRYAEQAKLTDFTRAALPQGLVASGFFANVVLLPFDDALRAAIGTEIGSGIQLVDACRYVDDMRVLIAIDPKRDSSPNDLEKTVSTWLSRVLETSASGLALSSKKTQVAAIGSEERPLVRHSARMRRIQTAVSGGFDALGGEEVLDAIQGLIRAQEALNTDDDSGWRLSPVPDVRDETVARFGAARYRTTFRSIRPLLQDDAVPDKVRAAREETSTGGRLRVARTRRELDDDARSFALGLIQRWINDPSNVRLLRIGLDIFPDVELLREVLSLVGSIADLGDGIEAPTQVAWYCLAEVLRAGATETGFVADNESLPSDIDFDSYREELGSEATRLLMLPDTKIPWYVRQQALLFLAGFDPASALDVPTDTEPETIHYRELIRFLCGQVDHLRSSTFATLGVVARRSFLDREGGVELVRRGLNPSRKRELALRDPSFLLELIHKAHDLVFDDLPARVREDLLMTFRSSRDGYATLAEAVLLAHPTGSLRNELALLRFATAFLERWQEQEPPPVVISPVQVQLKLTEEFGIAEVEDLQILRSRVNPSGSLYELPSWCEAGERWRIQLGFLLRFILSGQPDFTRPVRGASWKETAGAYRPAESHWYQRLYGLYSGQPAFGDDWLPITDWVEGFLLALLRWPGCRTPDGFDWVEQGINEARTQIDERIAFLDQRRGSATRALVLPLMAKRPTATNPVRPLRACVVQTAIPTFDDFHRADLSLNGRAIRRKHRNHLSAALAAVERMLALRETHTGSGRLDWLILPELAVHPKDVRTHLLPFARAHKAIVLTGLTYQEIIAGQPLVNSALWVIPEWSDAYGLQIRTRRQGKAHLAPREQEFNQGGAPILRGDRRCQWLIGYPWSNATDTQPVWLTAAVCYDATDLGLAADLRGISDVFAIPALNKDVKTFDQMALALHYHMFQLVVVANNGRYGGSNAYWPRSDTHIRQVFHMHGQPQASIAFLEIDDIGAFLERHDVAGANAGHWKHPPAGLSTP